MSSKIFALLLLATLAWAVPSHCQPMDMQPNETLTGYINRLAIPGAIRPLVVPHGRVAHVIFLDLATGRYLVNTYSRDLNQSLSQAVLASPEPGLGRPTDLRAAVGPGGRLAVFYETVDKAAGRSFLMGAVYALGDELGLLARTSAPIAQSPDLRNAVFGDEVLDDPQPVFDSRGLYVVTRIKQPLTATGAATLRIRGLSPDLSRASQAHDLDLSRVVAGGARQMGIWSGGGRHYVVISSTSGESPVHLDNTVPADLKLVTLDDDWRIIANKLVASEQGNTATNVSSLINDGTRFFLTHRQFVHSPHMMASVNSLLRVYDGSFNLLRTITMDRTTLGPGRGFIPRPSVAVSGDRVYLCSESPGLARIYVLDKAVILRQEP